MDEEIVDIVDENLKVLFQTTRREAHRKGFLHCTIVAQVIDSQKKWLLVRPAAGREDAGQYVCPIGGHIKNGESDLEALRRESGEELGLQHFAYKRIGQAISNRQTKGHIENHYYIFYEVYSNDEPILNEESMDCQRFTPQELKRKMKQDPAMFGDNLHFVIRSFYPGFASFQ
jgi:8-oxo-dGTP pyrophosphatase MutT (NUDIX family)